MHVNLELKIDYTKLFYQPGNRHKDPFTFYEFGSVIYLGQCYISTSENQSNNL